MVVSRRRRGGLRRAQPTASTSFSGVSGHELPASPTAPCRCRAVGVLVGPREFQQHDASPSGAGGLLRRSVRVARFADLSVSVVDTQNGTGNQTLSLARVSGDDHARHEHRGRRVGPTRRCALAPTAALGRGCSPPANSWSPTGAVKNPNLWLTRHGRHDGRQLRYGLAGGFSGNGREHRQHPASRVSRWRVPRSTKTAIGWCSRESPHSSAFKTGGTVFFWRPTRASTRVFAMFPHEHRRRHSLLFVPSRGRRRRATPGNSTVGPAPLHRPSKVGGEHGVRRSTGVAT